MPRPFSRVVASALLIGSPLVVTACGDDGDSEATSPATTAPASSPAPPPTAPAWKSLTGELQRCGPQPASVLDAPFETTTLRDPGVGRIPAVRLGRGKVVVVLLHQTDGGGLCGWIEFATTLAADPALTVLAIDLCGYGESRCTADADQVDPVELAARYARDDLQAKRVVVMGASMGGSVALMAAAALPGIDSAIDLSGPVEWQGMDTIREGRELPVPVLVAMADDEGEEQVTGARRIVDHAPEGSEFLPAEAGHGYELLNAMDGSLTPIADRVIGWLAAG